MYQNGMFTEVINPSSWFEIGTSNISKKCKLVGTVVKIFDKEIKSFVYSLDSVLSRVIIPKD